MRKLSSNIFFCALLLINSFALYQAILLQKRLSNIILAKAHSHFNYQHLDQQEIESALQTHTETSYLYPNYINFVWPTDTKDCSYYESLLTGFQSSIDELNNVSSVIYPTVSSTINDANTKISFTYLEFPDNAVAMSASDKNVLINSLQSGVAQLNDIISNDKCNYYVKWQDWAGTYLCAATAGSVDGKGQIDDKCVRFKMYYEGGTGNNRTYCFQNLYNGDFCTAEQSGDIPFTCATHWCSNTEIFSTGSTRANGNFTFTAYGGYPLYVSASLAPHADQIPNPQYSQFHAELI